MDKYETSGASDANVSDGAAQGTSGVPDGYCVRCEHANPPGSKVCERCGADLSAADVEREQTPPVESDSAVRGGKLRKAAAEAVEFEKGRHLIANAVTAVIALIVALVALFAPVKVMCYEQTVFDGDSVGHYVTVDQSIWKIAAAVLPLDAEKEMELQAEHAEAFEAAEKVWNEYRNGSEFDEKELNKAWKKYGATLSAELSDMNYFAYIKYIGCRRGMLPEQKYKGACFAAYAALAVSLIALSIAVFSVIAIVRAVIGIVKKRRGLSLFSYLRSVAYMSGAALAAELVNPYLKAGGGMLAVSVIAFAAYAVGAAINAYAVGGAKISSIIKSAVIAVGLAVSFYLLCTNILFASSNAMYKTDLRVPSGFGFYGLFSAPVGKNPMFHFGVVGTAATFFFAAAAVTLLIAFVCVADDIADGAQHCGGTAVRIMSSAAACILIAAVVVCAAGTAIINAEFGEIGHGISKFSVRAQGVAAAVIAAACFVCAVVFGMSRKKSKGSEINEGTQSA